VIHIEEVVPPPAPLENGKVDSGRVAIIEKTEYTD
jgi:hypothetical protein